MAVAGSHPQLHDPLLQHGACCTLGDSVLWDPVESICPAQCSMARMVEPCACAICEDMRAHAIGALTILSATARSARNSLDLRPDIYWARSGPKACAVGS